MLKNMTASGLRPKRHKAGATGRCKVKRRSINGYIKNAVQKQYRDDTGEEIEL